MSDKKIFEDFPEVDCNECEHWWTNGCDGVSKGSTANCNSFSATRSVVIPHQIKKLERRVFWLSVLLFGEYVAGAIAVLVGWLLGKI